MTTVNGQTAEPGCYIAGHHGQYGMDQLADVVEQFGWEFGAEGSPDIDDDPRMWRRGAEAESSLDAIPIRNSHGIGQHLATPDECWERHMWAVDRLEEWLNDHTDGGYWSWEDGEFFLTQTEAEGWVYVIAPDYEEAWELLRDGVEGAIYADRYQACELAEDAGEGENVYQFRTTYHYELFAGDRKEVEK
jgi:hypothetical protein